MSGHKTIPTVHFLTPAISADILIRAREGRSLRILSPASHRGRTAQASAVRHLFPNPFTST